MTKADILKLLARVPMNTEIVFVSEPAPSFHQGDVEHEVKAAFTTVGMKGLTVLLTDGRAPDYDDLESL
jgi:hypothetical protein